MRASPHELGTNLAECSSLRGVCIGCLLDGERPADLPVQQATEIELIIDLKTARMLGLTRPPSPFGRVDELIE
jgi:putative ABC transport system substrate-binding protein